MITWLIRLFLQRPFRIGPTAGGARRTTAPAIAPLFRATQPMTSIDPGELGNETLEALAGLLALHGNAGHGLRPLSIVEKTLSASPLQGLSLVPETTLRKALTQLSELCASDSGHRFAAPLQQLREAMERAILGATLAEFESCHSQAFADTAFEPHDFDDTEIAVPEFADTAPMVLP